ncbi:MAG: hypothetical protein EAS52_08400, partial [Parapedobacter sp.]
MIMIKLTRLAVAVALLLSTNLYAQSEVSIIPQPLQLEQKQGAYVLTEKAFIQVDNGNTELKALGELLVQGLFERTGTRLSLVPSRADNGTTATIVLQ